MSDKNLFRVFASRTYEKAIASAKAILATPKQLIELVGRTQSKIQARIRHLSGDIGSELSAALRMVKAYADGDYKEISTESLVSVVIAAVYFLMPFDAIPDFFLALGLTDDIALLTWTLSKIRDELEHYKSWELRQNSISPDCEALPNPSDEQQ